MKIINNVVINENNKRYDWALEVETSSINRSLTRLSASISEETHNEFLLAPIGSIFNIPIQMEEEVQEFEFKKIDSKIAIVSVDGQALLVLSVTGSSDMFFAVILVVAIQ